MNMSADVDWFNANVVLGIKKFTYHVLSISFLAS